MTLKDGKMGRGFEAWVKLSGTLPIQTKSEHPPGKFLYTSQKKLLQASGFISNHNSMRGSARPGGMLVAQPANGRLDKAHKLACLGKQRNKNKM